MLKKIRASWSFTEFHTSNISHNEEFVPISSQHVTNWYRCQMRKIRTDISHDYVLNTYMYEVKFHIYSMYAISSHC